MRRTALRIALACGLAGGLACSKPNLDLQAPDAGNINALLPGVCSGAGWCWRNPLPQGEPMNGVWGTALNDVWAVGNAGVVVHWDGTSWSANYPGTSSDLLTVWGPNDGSGDVFVAGTVGATYHWSGSSGTWAQIMYPLSGTAPDITAIWGSSATNIWAVGKLAPCTSNCTDAATLLSLTGAGMSTWTVMSDITIKVNLWGVWGSSADDVWVVGDRQPGGADPTVVHYGGPDEGWKQDITFKTPGADSLEAIFGTSTDDVWAVGVSGVVGHWSFDEADGGTGQNPSWTFPSTGATVNLSSVWSGSPGDVWIAGVGAAYHVTGYNLDGGSWPQAEQNLTQPGSATATENLTGIWGSSTQDVWMVGSPASVSAGQVGQGEILHLSDLGANGQSFSATASDLSGSFIAPDLSSVRFVGTPGVVLLSVNGAWATEPVIGPSENSSVVLTSIAGNAVDDIWAVGLGGAIAHWDGASWSMTDSPTTEDLNAVGGADTSWAVGNSGTILQRVGTSWFEVKQSPATENLYAVFGTSDTDVWAVGDEGTILHWTGGADAGNDGWSGSALANGLDKPLYAVWGSSASGLFIAGEAGVYEQSNSAWVQVTDVTGTNFTALSGRITGEVWAVGTSGTAWHFDGSNWKPSQTGASLDLLSVAMTPQSKNGSTWVSGRDGLVLELNQ